MIHCGDSTDEIARAIRYALSEDGQRLAREAENPYFRPDTLDIIVKFIAETPLSQLKVKKFYDN